MSFKLMNLREETKPTRINIQNVHPKLRLRKRPIQLLVRNILRSEKTDSAVDVVLVDDEFMERLNRKFTKRDGTTDVLSFGMKEGNTDPVEYPGLGDVYVSLDQAKRQAETYRVAFERQAALLVAHGVLHLLGYDHGEKKRADRMRRKERKYLKSIDDFLKSV